MQIVHFISTTIFILLHFPCTGRESFSINKELEDKVTELEAKLLSIERGRPKRRPHRSTDRSSPIDDRSLRRLRRKSLDSATASDSMKLLMRLSSLDTKIANITTSNESLNTLYTSEETSLITGVKEKVNECLAQIAAMKNRSKRSPSPNSERLSLLEHSLSEICDVLTQHVCGMSGAEAEVVNASASSVVKQLQSLLVDKLANLAEKRRKLRENNELDGRKRLELLAEKIAYENVLIARIQEALHSPGNGEPVCERLTAKETRETAFLIDSFHAKLNGTTPKFPPPCKTSAEYLAKILAKYLVNTPAHLKTTPTNPEATLTKPYTTPTSLKATPTNPKAIPTKPAHFKHTPSIDSLLEQRRRVDVATASYRASQLPLLAQALATEALDLTTDKTCRLSENILEEFSKTARETVTRELIESEINHVLLRAAQIYESNFSADSAYFFSFFASERAALELWSDSVENRLYLEVNKSVQEITEEFQKSLERLKYKRKSLDLGRNCRNSSKMLAEYADIVAHKALIDARIDVLTGENHQITLEAPGLPSDGVYKLTELNDFDGADEVDSSCFLQGMGHGLEAEFRCLVGRFSGACLDELDREEWGRFGKCFAELCREVESLRRSVSIGWESDGEELEAGSWEELRRRCLRVTEQLRMVRKAFCDEVQIYSKR